MTPEMNIPNYIQILFGKIHQLEEEVLDLKELLHRKPAKVGESSADKQLFTVQEAAQFLSVSTNTIYILKADNKIPYMQKGRRIYFSRESLLKWLQEGSQATNTPEISQQQVVQRYLKPRRRKLGS